MSVYHKVIRLCFILVLFPQQGDPDPDPDDPYDQDIGNLSSAQDLPDAESLSSLQRIEQLTGIYIHVHSAAILYC